MSTRKSFRMAAFFAMMISMSGALRAAEPVDVRKAEDVPLDRGVGRQVANFTLKDATSGRSISLYDYFGKKAVVVVFTGIDCPISNVYMPRLVELEQKYRDKGVAFVAINSNSLETAEQVAEHAKKFGVTFSVLKDPGNLVADLNLVERTSEVLVIDGRARLGYRGAIDDQYAIGARKEAPAHTYLADALDALIADQPIKVTASDVAGCPLDRADPKPILKATGPRVRAASPEILAGIKEREKDAAVDVGQVTYSANVAPIVQAQCQSCHRPGQSGPFSLLTYDDARKWSASIKEVVDERRMPPWHADPRYGHFENERILSAKDRATLLAWVDQGAPLGDPSAMPAPRTFPEGWMIGTPDVVFEVPDYYVVAAQGVLPYQHFKVPTNFKEDRWIQAVEARPGEKSVVHHIIVYVDDHKQGEGRRNERLMHLVGFAPGDLPSIYPAGTAKLIPAGSDLIFQIHYTPMGHVKSDKSSVAFVFAKEPPAHKAVTLGISQQKFAIPPGNDNYAVSSTFTFPTDAHLLNLMPHMHLRGKDFKYTATYPDGSTEILLSVPAYDFGWQSMYRLTEPKSMPKGTRIDCAAHFDNSAKNTANPDPTKTVRWGEQTFEEMMIGFIDFSADGPMDLKASGTKAARAEPVRIVVPSVDAPANAAAPR
jgi:peroxiredoxin/mono/diheme cytochrome c family protein